MSCREMPPRWRPPLHLRKARAPRRRNRAPARRPRRRILPPSICPCRASRSGTGRRVARRSLCQTSVAAKKTQRRQQRQAEHGEIVAVEPFEQLNAKTFELISADARRRGIADDLEIVVEELVRNRPHGQAGDADMFEQHYTILDKGDRRIKLVGAAGKGAQLLTGRRPVGRFGKSAAVEREGLIGAENEAPAIALGYHGGFFTSQESRDRHRCL